MRVFLLVILFSVASKNVVAQSENEVKRGAFPYMAFVYYPDETILDSGGARFTRAAILISDNWLISSSDVAIGFPKKTLLARIGAIVLDYNFTLNEDEEEQEREIILVMHPYNYSVKEWWNTDISLLKTLLPFNSTMSAAPAALVSNPDTTDKPCFILVYARRSDNTTERTLMKMLIELLPSTQENCGAHFKKETMTCGVDFEEKVNNGSDPNFCQGNSGGPLICDNELTGLQTYVDDCNQPYLYQLLTVWEKFISCAKTEQYLSESCRDICVILSKDPPVSSTPEIVQEEPTDSADTLVKDEKYLISSINTSQEQSTASTDKDIAVAATEKETSKVTINDTDKQITNNTSIITTNYSHDTKSSTSSDLLTDTGENVPDSTEERKRNNQIEARRHLVRGKAFINTSYPVYSIISILMLVYLT